MEMCSAAAITHSNVQRRALCVNGIFIVIVAVIRMIVFAYLLRSTIWRCTTACFTPNTVRTLRWASFKWVKFNILFDVCDTHAALCAKQFIYLLRNIHMDPFTFISIDCKFSILSTVCPIRTTHFAEQRICAQFEWCERRCVARVSAVNLLRVCRNKIDCSRGITGRRCDWVWGAKWWTAENLVFSMCQICVRAILSRCISQFSRRTWLRECEDSRK